MIQRRKEDKKLKQLMGITIVIHHSEAAYIVAAAPRINHCQAAKSAARSS